MKKVLFTILTALFLIGIQPLSHAAAAAKNETYSIFIDGKRVLTSSRAFVEKGTTLIPLEPVAKVLDMKYIYNKKTKTATITKDNASATFIMGNKAVIINGNKQGIIIAPKEKSGVVYVPLTIVGQVAKLPINVDSDTKAVQIGKKVQLDQFFNMNWGMSKDQVKKLENRTLKYEGKTSDMGMDQLSYAVEFGTYKMPGIISYFFEDNKLVEVYLHYSSTSFIYPYTVYADSYEHLNNLYGEYEHDLLWDTDEYMVDVYWSLYEDDTQSMFEDAIGSKDLYFLSKYKNKDAGTDITLILSNIRTNIDPQFITYMHFVSTNK